MINRREMLLICLCEECSELSQRATKALRFGLGEIQNGQSQTNSDRLVDEFKDLLAIMDLLKDEGAFDLPLSIPYVITRDKRLKLQKWIEYSATLGIYENEITS